jgi:outer membrane protein assembly factor BamB
MIWRPALLAALILSVQAVPAQAADWPQAGGGPAHQSAVAGPNAISVATVGHLHVVWCRSVGTNRLQPPYISGTVVSQGRVYFTVETTQELWALRASDGTTLWHRGIGTPDGPLPAVAGGVVYVQGGGWIRAFDAATGAPLWERQDGGSSQPAVVAAGTVYVTSADACCAAGLAAYRATDGRLLWVRRVPGVSSMAAPAVVNGVVFTTSYGTSCCLRTDFGLWALDGTTGRTLWVRYPPLNASTYPPGVHGTPSVAGGVLYAGGQDAYTTAGRRVWINDAPLGTADASPAVTAGSVYYPLQEGDVSNGGVCRYRRADGVLFWCVGSDEVYDSPTAVNGVLLVDIVGNYLWAFDAGTGRDLFHDENHVISGQPAVVGDTVYTGGYWKVFAFRP